MTDIKVLPGNLKAIEKKPRFAQFYKSHNVEALQEILVDLEVNYRSDDNKAALVWRVMDAKGMDFDGAANDRIDEQDDSMAQDELNTGENVETDKAHTDENVQTVQDDTSDEHGDQSNIEVGTDGDKASADSGENLTKWLTLPNMMRRQILVTAMTIAQTKLTSQQKRQVNYPPDDSAPIDETPSEKFLEQNNTPRESLSRDGRAHASVSATH